MYVYTSTSKYAHILVGAVLRWGQHEITWGHLLKVSGQDEHSEAEIPETVSTIIVLNAWV